MEEFLQKYDNLRKHLIENKLTYSQAFEQIRKFPKPWETAEWKRESISKRKKYCEQCGNSEGIMNLIHLRQPLPFAELKEWISSQFLYDFCETNNINKQLSEIKVTDEEIQSHRDQYTEVRDTCPRCIRSSFKARKTITPLYRCIQCGFEFDEPIKSEYLTSINMYAVKVNLEEVLTFNKQNSVFQELKKTFTEINDHRFSR